LKDVRWFTRQEIRTVLEHPGGSRFRREHYEKIKDEKQNTDQRSSSRKQADSVTDLPTPVVSKTAGGQAGKNNQSDEPPFKIPPVYSIAGLLIRDWIKGKITFQPDPRGFKGNL
jgi:NAD+ diphosphatase